MWGWAGLPPSTQGTGEKAGGWERQVQRQPSKVTSMSQSRQYLGDDKRDKGHRRASEQSGQPGGGGAALGSWPHKEAAVQGQSTG